MTPLRALFAWLVLLAVAFANGTFRVLCLNRWLAEQRANQLACALGIVLIVSAVWLLSRRWRFSSAAQAWMTGCLWLVLTVAWEFLFGRFVFHQPWERLLQEYAIWQGRLWVLVLAAILLVPVVVHVLDESRSRRLPPENDMLPPAKPR